MPSRPVCLPRSRRCSPTWSLTICASFRSCSQANRRGRPRRSGASSPAPSISAPAAPAPGFSMRGGNLLGRADYPIVMNVPQPGHAEHDSEDIWRAACAATRGALANAGARPDEIVGISFDATCSLVVRDRAGASSASRPAAASAGTPSSGSTIARSPKPTTARRPATTCSTISAASCRRRCRRRS